MQSIVKRSDGVSIFNRLLKKGFEGWQRATLIQNYSLARTINSKWRAACCFCCLPRRLLRVFQQPVKLSDAMKNDLDGGTPSFDETEKQLPQPIPGNKDRSALGDAKTSGKGLEPEDLTAPPAPAEENAFVEPSGAFKLVRRLSFNFEPRHAAPHSLRAALIPYIAATAIFAIFVLIAGSALVYFLTGSLAPVRTTGAVAPAKPQVYLSTARPDQPESKCGFQRAAPQAACQLAPAPAMGSSQGNIGLFVLSAEQNASKPTATQQLETCVCHR